MNAMKRKKLPSASPNQSSSMMPMISHITPRLYHRTAPTMALPMTVGHSEEGVLVHHELQHLRDHGVLVR